MKKVYILLCVMLTSFLTSAQLLTWTPVFSKDKDNISITVEAAKGMTILPGRLTRRKHRILLIDKINNLPAGTYLLRIQAANKTIPIKLMIQSFIKVIVYDGKRIKA